MKRRHFITLPILAAFPLPARADTFRDECKPAVGNAIQDFCRRCHNAECADAKGPQNYWHRLDVFRVMPEGQHLAFIHVSPRVFEQMVVESSQSIEGGRFLTPWPGTKVIRDSSVSDEMVKLDGYAQWPRTPVGGASRFSLVWEYLVGRRIDLSWNHGYVQVSEEVDFQWPLRPTAATPAACR